MPATESSGPIFDTYIGSYTGLVKDELMGEGGILSLSAKTITVTRLWKRFHQTCV